ncbi:hypothetical protein V8C34DRAFT_290207 [Trichoderma compactum]
MFLSGSTAVALTWCTQIAASRYGVDTDSPLRKPIWAEAGWMSNRMWENVQTEGTRSSKIWQHEPAIRRRRLYDEQSMVYSSVGGTAATRLVLEGSPKACRKSVGSHSSISVRSVLPTCNGRWA